MEAAGLTARVYEGVESCILSSPSVFLDSYVFFSFDCCFRARSLLIMTFMFSTPFSCIPLLEPLGRLSCVISEADVPICETEEAMTSLE
jgi:hypothetical protein